MVSDRDVMVDAGTGIDVAGLLETGIADDARRCRAARWSTPTATSSASSPGRPPGVPTASRSRSSTVRDVRDQLDGSGKVTHGWIGVLCDKDPAESRPQGGATVQAVVAGQPRRPTPGWCPATWSIAGRRSAGEQPRPTWSRRCAACAPRTRWTSSTTVAAPTRRTTLTAR